MDKLVIHPHALHALYRLRQNLPHAILLTGNRGVGLRTIADSLAMDNYRLEGIVEPRLISSASSIPAINVETIRELYVQTRTSATHNRVILIDDADMMTLSAQNSFLKLLEEPTSYTHFVLTSHAPDNLAPTIRSRVQTIHIPDLEHVQTQHYLDNLPNVQPEKQQQIMFIASGLPAEIQRLLSDDEYFSKSVHRMSLAKQLIEASSYTRIALLMKQKLKRPEALLLIENCIRLLRINPSPSSIRKIDALIECSKNSRYGGNVTLQLVAAMV